MIEPSHSDLPLALGVLHEELDAVSSQFPAARHATDQGQRRAARKDLVRNLNRYIRLEAEVFYPVLERAGIGDEDAPRRHAELRTAMHQLDGAADSSEACPPELTALEAAFEAYRSIQENQTFPRAARDLGDELPALALELDEVRQRLHGAYGV